MSFITHPTRIHEVTNVDYTIPVFSDRMKIVCLYYPTNTTTMMDLLDTYLSFDWSYFLSIILTFLFFTATWSLCSIFARRMSPSLKDEIDRGRKPAYWVMLCAILDQDQYPSISMISFTILFLCFSSFFYLFIDCFMLNTISTDLVVTAEPRVIRDYNDIIQRSDVKVVFLPGMNEEFFFKDAQPGTVEEQIWSKRYIIESISMEELIGLLLPLVNQQFTIILR